MRFALLFSAFLAVSASAQAPYLVADLKTTADNARGSGPGFLLPINGAVLFVKGQFRLEQELWRTDGTAAGTYRLLVLDPPADIAPVIAGLVTANNAVYFGALVEGQGGWRIWRTDGTVAGTVPLSTASTDQVRVLGVAGNRVFYNAGAGRELWVLDGTATRLLTDSLRTTTGSAVTAVTFNNAFYAAAETGLWKSDGTVAGTVKLTAMPSYAVAVHKNMLLFGARTTEAGGEVWTSDGTEAGTRMITDLQPGTGSSFGFTGPSIASLGEVALFVSGGVVVGVTDGTAAGSRILKTGSSPPTVNYPRIAVANGIGYFRFSDAQFGRELWRSDGTEAGTFRLTDTRDERPNSFTIVPIVAGATKVFFWALNGQFPNEFDIFESDGTVAGTRLLPAPGRGSTWAAGTSVTPATTVTIGDTVFFPAGDAHGDEPWISSNGNTRMIANLEPEDAGSSNPAELFASSDRVYFNATLDDGGDGVWSSDGTGPGTHLLFDVDRTTDRPVPRAAIGNIVYFTNRRRLLKSDGTPEGTVLVKEFGDSIQAGYAADGRAYFEVDGALWITDGTEAGTIALAAKSSARLSNVIAVAGQTYFMLDEVLYATDGTLAGTRTVGRVPRGTFGDRLLVPFGGAVILFSRDGWWRFSTSAADAVKLKDSQFVQVVSAAQAGTALLFMDDAGALWKTDGTAAGTVKLAQINSPSTTPLVSLGTRVLFTAHDGATGYQVWVSDGTAEGTKVLVPAPGAALELFAADGVAYFAGSDIELWQTDGTANGTHRVADVEPETTLSPRDFARAGDLLYFGGMTAATGRELWAYPLPQNATVTVDDVRVRENAGSATVTVRLTRASTRSVAVSYQTADDSALAGRDYTAASGTVTFSPGQTAKSISIALTDNAAANATRSFFVNATSADAPVERAAGAAVIEDDDTLADVSLTAGRTGLTVTNAGPSAVSNVVLCFSLASVELQCTAPSELAAGAAFTHNLDASERPLTARVTQWERDANPTNNQVSIAFAGFLTADPATPRAGSTSTLTITLGSAATDRVVQLSSSDPSVLSVPAAVTVPAASPSTPVTLTAHKSGVAIITATAPSGMSRITVHVAGTSEAVRLATVMTAQRGSWRFGDDNVVQYRVQGVTLDGTKPSGTVTVFERGLPVLSAPVVSGVARIAASHVLPGVHAYTATYSGDANFFPSALPEEQVHVAKGGVSMIAYRESGSSQVTVTIRGVLGRPPAGTVNGQPLVRSSADSSSVKVSGIAATARTISVSYSGDAAYDSSSLTIPIANSGRGRSARH